MIIVAAAHLPFCKFLQSFWGHSWLINLGPWLVFYDHFFVEFLYELIRLARLLHYPQQMGLIRKKQVKNYEITLNYSLPPPICPTFSLEFFFSRTQKISAFSSSQWPTHRMYLSSGLTYEFKIDRKTKIYVFFPCERAILFRCLLWVTWNLEIKGLRKLFELSKIRELNWVRNEVGVFEQIRNKQSHECESNFCKIIFFEWNDEALISSLSLLGQFSNLLLW